MNWGVNVHIDGTVEGRKILSINLIKSPNFPSFILWALGFQLWLKMPGEHEQGEADINQNWSLFLLLEVSFLCGLAKSFHDFGLLFSLQYSCLWELL